MSNLVETWGTNLFNTLHRMGGGVVPGSIEDKQRKIVNQAYDKMLNPPAPKPEKTPGQQLLETVQAQMAADRLDAKRRGVMLQQAGAPTLLGVKQGMSDIALNEKSQATNETIRLEGARLNNDTAMAKTLTDQQLRMFGPLTTMNADVLAQQERQLDRAIGYYERSQDKAMDEDKFLRRAALIGAIGAAIGAVAFPGRA